MCNQIKHRFILLDHISVDVCSLCFDHDQVQTHVTSCKVNVQALQMGLVSGDGCCSLGCKNKTHLWLGREFLGSGTFPQRRLQCRECVRPSPHGMPVNSSISNNVIALASSRKSLDTYHRLHPLELIYYTQKSQEMFNAYKTLATQQSTLVKWLWAA